MIGPLDRGFTLGDGLFETVLWEDGALRRAGEHLARLAGGCTVLGLPAPDLGEAERRMRQAVETAGLEEQRAAVRLSWSAGPGGRGLERPDRLEPTLVAAASPAPRPARPWRLATSTVRRNEGSPASRLKTLSYLDNVLARREAKAAGADEALMLNNRGEVACAAAGNLFWIDADGRLLTPALACGVLAGVTRARVLAAAGELGREAAEVRAGPHALDSAQGVFVTNSLVGLQPVLELDGTALPSWPELPRLAEAAR